MAWLILIISGALEAVWATALAASDGLKRRAASVLFIVALTASMLTLAWAMRSLPTGTAYAVWVGIGATLTAGWSIATKQERLTAGRVALIGLLVVSIIGLRVVS